MIFVTSLKAKPARQEEEVILNHVYVFESILVYSPGPMKAVLLEVEL